MKKMESCQANFERVVDICYLWFKQGKWKKSHRNTLGISTNRFYRGYIGVYRESLNV